MVHLRDLILYIFDILYYKILCFVYCGTFGADIGTSNEAVANHIIDMTTRIR